MSTEKNILPPEINLVCFNKPQLVLNQMKEMPPSKKVDSLESGDDVTTPKRLDRTEVLNSILPPKEWVEDGKHFRQTISKQLASKLEVKKLSEKLDTYLEKFNAKNVGTCPIRRELYSQCFNEAIRQTTLNCVERGYMMVKIRNEINATIDGYQKLYESVTAYRIRKALLGEQKKIEQLEKADRLRSENETLVNDLAKILAKREEVLQEMAEARQMEIDRHAKQLADVKKANDLIKDQVLSIIAPKKNNRP